MGLARADINIAADILFYLRNLRRRKLHETQHFLGALSEDRTLLRKLAAKGTITVQTSAYGGFEQVGSLGISLPLPTCLPRAFSAAVDYLGVREPNVDRSPRQRETF